MCQTDETLGEFDTITPGRGFFPRLSNPATPGVGKRSRMERVTKRAESSEVRVQSVYQRKAFGL